MRVLASMLSFRDAQPMDLWDQFIPKADGKRAAKDLAKLRRRDPHAVAFCHQSPWHVPIRWFVLFRDEGALAGGRRVRAHADALPHEHASRDAPR